MVGVEVAVPRVAEASVAGAAILAAAGVAIVADEREGIDALVRVAGRLAPNPAAQSLYDRLAPEYEGLHARLAPVNEVLGALDAAAARGRGDAASSAGEAQGVDGDRRPPGRPQVRDRHDVRPGSQAPTGERIRKWLVVARRPA